MGEHHGHDLDNDPNELREKGWQVGENDQFPYDIVELNATLEGPGTIFMRLSYDIHDPEGVYVFLDDALVLHYRPKEDEEFRPDSDGIWIQYNPDVVLRIKGRYLEIYEFQVFCPGKLFDSIFIDRLGSKSVLNKNYFTYFIFFDCSL